MIAQREERSEQGFMEERNIGSVMRERERESTDIFELKEAKVTEI